MNDGPFMPFNGTLTPDPSNGMSPALIWDLSSIGQAPVGNGDILILDPGGALSDVLRFTDSLGQLTDQNGTASTATLMIFYSSPGLRAADTGFPANLASGNFGSISENQDGTFFYGFGEGTDNYFGTSDVPEPQSWISVASAFLGIALARRRTTRRQCHPSKY